MSTVRLTTTVLPVARRGDDGELILDAGGGRLLSAEEAELLAVGPDHADRPPTVLPYRAQDAYEQTLEPTRQRVAILENERLRAIFLLDLGGRLWSLVDRTTGRETLHTPDAVRFANFGLRNAWFAGGVEWNLGMTGHWALNAAPICAGVVTPDEDTPHDVLRLWTHERLTGLTWRLDAWLPGGSDALFVHPVLANPTGRDVAVYWWSNIAVPQDAGTRVLADAAAAFHFGYADRLSRVDVPLRDGIDASYPQHHPGAADYFFEPRGAAPWIAAVDATGRGLAQASTPELVGRKLFTWGQGRGAETWQRRLSGDTSYAEIQAGLARTQLEHLRLPAGATWRFTESYRPIDIGPAAGAAWPEAVAAAGDAAVDHDALARAHDHLTTHEDAPVTPENSLADRATGPAGSPEPSAPTGSPEPADDADPAPGSGSEAAGWGALEVAAGHRAHDPATPYDPGSLDAEQRAWLDLARGRGLSPALQRSAMIGPDWRAHLAAAEDGWLRDLLLGHVELADDRTGAARERWSRSAARHETPDALRALGLTTEDAAEAADLLVRACRHDLTRRGIAVEALTALLAAGRHRQTLELLDDLPAAVRKLPRAQFLEARARVAAGDAEGAAALIEQPLVLPDLREGDLGLEDLWRDYQHLIGGAAPLPAHYDFRMAPGAAERGCYQDLGSPRPEVGARRSPRSRYREGRDGHTSNSKIAGPSSTRSRPALGRSPHSNSPTSPKRLECAWQRSSSNRPPPS